MLYTELVEWGWRGSRRTVQHYLQLQLVVDWIGWCWPAVRMVQPALTVKVSVGPAAD